MSWVYDVSFSRGLRWFVILLLPLTLAWKISTLLSGAPTEPDIQRKVAEFLVRQHFNVAFAQAAEGSPTIRAAAGACRILIANSSPMAWERDALGRYATADDRVFVVFAGRIYPQQPTWLTVPDYLWFRLRHELGFNVQRTPILTVIANTTCEAERLPWGELG